MSEHELEFLRQKKLRELRRRFETSTKEETAKAETAKPEDVLNQFLIERSWEVLNAAKKQYPKEASQIENLLVKLITEEKIKEKITGKELYALFRRLGLRVHLQTRIQVIEHGKIKSLEEKIKEETTR